MKLFLAVSAAALFAVSAPALAGDWPSTPDQLGGTWSLSGVSEGDASCVFQLGVEQTIGGWTIDLPPACKTAFAVGDVTAWHVNPDTGAIVFADAERHTVFEFDRGGDGDYVANPQGKPAMVIQKGDPADQHPPTAQEAMTGVWRISALGKGSLCSFTLTSDEKGKHGTMTVRPGCISEWASRGFAKWSIGGKSISLMDAKGNEILGFKRDDMFTFDRQASDDPYSRTGEMMFFGKVF